MEEQHRESTPDLLRNNPPSGSLSQEPFRSAMSPPIYRRSTPRSFQPSPRIPRSESIRRSQSAASMSPPVSVSSQMRNGELLQSIESRSLPSRNINDATIDDAYVDFIFYCNPGVPTATNTSELRRMFRSPPRSDGKSFSIYTLWQLVQKLNRKELKTWIQLAIELGVEPPSVEKKQSTQKVQQYAVRLKRWMRAMHVDAFFDYCFGKQHAYYSNLRISNDQDGDSRDDVPREEDLALRALFPEWKPKKGRKKALDESKNAKRQRLDTRNLGADNNSHSYVSWSAIPDDFEHHEGWATNSVFSTGSQTEHQRHIGPPAGDQRWEFPGAQRLSPLRYPQSAVTPRSRNHNELFEREPRSAITPNSAYKILYKRRKDQSTASPWVSSRSLPPNEAGSQSLEGAAKADPGVAFYPPMTMAYGTPSAHVSSDEVGLDRVGQGTTGNIPQDSAGSFASPNAAPRPIKLQLQVPKGSPRAPIRLATPQLLVNGEFCHPSASTERQAVSEATHQQIQNSHDVDRGPFMPANNQNIPPASLSLDNVSRMFSFEIQNGRTLGSAPSLTDMEAGAIADAIIKQISSQCAPSCPSDMVALYCAVCLGLGHQFGYDSRRLGQLTIEFLPEVGTMPKARDMNACMPTPSTALDNISHEPQRTQCLINYEFALSPGIATKTTIQVPIPTLDRHGHGKLTSTIPRETDRAPKNNQQTAIDDSDDDLFLLEAGVDWKQRYLNLKKQIRKRDAALRQYKKNILEVVMNDV
ncbi:hypothetical protein PRK78_001821 [Emydomyces testavorans]|uniref:ARS binding protein Abp2 n=1 Tax=Emydomyces testavorans TaxID=2070801 RepID=A0AAF0DDN5_9EURO|nr:hypothetical protein PRK78_001821 [Emydomyces testavorans]